MELDASAFEALRQMSGRFAADVGAAVAERTARLNRTAETPQDH
jgi:hypothetical protein